MNQARATHGYGACSISWPEIHAWQQVRQVQLSPWEVETVFAIDRVVMRILNKKPAKASQ